MYLYICKNMIIKKENIIGIFDVNSIKETKEFQELFFQLKERHKLIDISERIQKSFILIKENKEYKAYISNVSVGTLEKRIN